MARSRLALSMLLSAAIVLASDVNSTESGNQTSREKRQYYRASAARSHNPFPATTSSFAPKDLFPNPLGKFDFTELSFSYPFTSGSFQYQHRPQFPSADPYGPKPVNPYTTEPPKSYPEPEPFFEPKPAYKPAYKLEPAYKPSYKPEPAYKPKYKPEPAYKPNYKPEPAYKPEYKPEPAYKPAYEPEPAYKPEYPKPKPESYGYKPEPYAAHYCPAVAGLESSCRPVAECAVWYDDLLYSDKVSCKLPDGALGACCPDLPYNRKGQTFKAPKKDVKLYVPITVHDLNAAAEEGKFAIHLIDETEKLLKQKGIVVRRNSASYNHLLFFQTNQFTIKRSRDALLGVETTKELGKRFHLSPDEAGFGLSQFSLRDTIIGGTCPAEPECHSKAANSPFRTLDGTCNNLKRGSWGRSRSPFQRALTAAYADGVWFPRLASDGGEMPSARLVSISVIPDIDNPHESHTLWVMQYGQFLDHDMTSTPVFRMEANATGIVCCGEDGRDISNSAFVHPECLPIEIPEDDPFFSRHGQRCMSFVRSMPAPRLDCNFGHGEQMNQLTHYLDNSNVYGSDEDEARALRSFKGGKLLVTPRGGHRGGRDLLPPDNDPEMDCTLPKNLTGIDPPKEVKCFKAGDSRANEQPDLAVTHTIFMREHNRLTDELAKLNPYWDDERLYQEARRILIAQMQHITYNEWLPIIIGREKMEKQGLFPLAYGFSSDYDENVNPTIVNEFATAGFRFGHSLVQGQVELLNERRKQESDILLRHHFFKSQVLYTPGNLERFLVGLATQPIQDFDNYVSEELTNHLFQEVGKNFGMDLVALNIQRGRDHGLQSYNDYRVLCGLPRARRFEDLHDYIAKPIVERFRLLYRSVDDIDLFIGGISERPAPGALIGPTFQCIVSDQFTRLKRGDRYFYDLGGQAGSFSEEQLNEIRKTSFARLICDNSDVYSMQPLAFRQISEVNLLVDCDSPSIPRLNLVPWQEYKQQHYDPYYF